MVANIQTKKGKFLEEGEVAEVTIYIEDGYKLGTLKVLSNDEELALVSENEYCYKATFEPTEDFAITFTGAVAKNIVHPSFCWKHVFRLSRQYHEGN